MLVVVKRSGKQEAFQIEKIQKTLAAASDELRQPLSSADLHTISDEIVTRVSGRDSIEAQELFDMLVGTLNRLGFRRLAESYLEHGSPS